MKLFLSSLSVSPKQLDAFLKLVNKKPEDIKLAFIDNAADGESGDKLWVDEHRDSIVAHNIKVFSVDLNNYLKNSSDLKNVLSNFDVIWIGGGNVLYLRWLLKRTTADKVITELINNGTVYGGGSAGAIIVGPTLNYMDDIENIDAIPRGELVFDGLNIIDTVVLPHWGNEKFGSVMSEIDKKLKRDGYKTQQITDDEALIIDGNSRSIAK